MQNPSHGTKKGREGDQRPISVTGKSSVLAKLGILNLAYIGNTVFKWSRKTILGPWGVLPFTVFVGKIQPNIGGKQSTAPAADDFP